MKNKSTEEKEISNQKRQKTLKNKPTSEREESIRRGTQKRLNTIANKSDNEKLETSKKCL